MKKLIAFLLATVTALSALTQDAVQKFKIVGDYSSKWEVYEVVEDKCGNIDYVPELSGNTVRNKELRMDVFEEGVFMVVEYKCESRKEESNRTIFIVVTEDKNRVKKLDINKCGGWDDGYIMIVDYKQQDFDS